jgi:hypothetical protein
VHRRELLRAAGAAGALAILPRDAFAAWTRVARSDYVATSLGTAELALIAAAADTLLPRTDSPSATDVGVPAFIDVYVTDYLNDGERTAFLAGLERIDARARRFTGVPFAEASADWRGEIITSIEADDRRAEPGRTWWRLKDLIIHGYFTSAPVMKSVLHYEVMPGRFDGDVIIPERPTQAGVSRDD